MGFSFENHSLTISLLRYPFFSKTLFTNYLRFHITFGSSFTTHTDSHSLVLFIS